MSDDHGESFRDRTVRRLNRLRSEMLDAPASNLQKIRSKLCGAEDMIRQIIDDEEPVWPGK